VQDTLFPTICCVAGPNELGYLGQLKQVYDYFQVPMPLMHPRASVTLLIRAAARFLQERRALEALQPQDESALNAPPRSSAPSSNTRSPTSAKAVDERMGT
jgi:hypothetical protein